MFRKVVPLLLLLLVVVLGGCSGSGAARGAAPAPAAGPATAIPSAGSPVPVPPVRSASPVGAPRTTGGIAPRATGPSRGSTTRPTGSAPVGPADAPVPVAVPPVLRGVGACPGCRVTSTRVEVRPGVSVALLIRTAAQWGYPQSAWLLSYRTTTGRPIALRPLSQGEVFTTSVVRCDALHRCFVVAGLGAHAAIPNIVQVSRAAGLTDLSGAPGSMPMSDSPVVAVWDRNGDGVLEFAVARSIGSPYATAPQVWLVYGARGTAYVLIGCRPVTPGESRPHGALSACTESRQP